jgi:deoxyribodipyrimidine photo-lyase
VNVVVEPGQKVDRDLSSKSGIVWFRNDLRLTDHRPLQAAMARHPELLCVYVHDVQQDQALPWGFCPMGPHRRRFLADTLITLHVALTAKDQALWVVAGDPAAVIASLAAEIGASTVYCEDIAAPFEQDHVQQLEAAGRTVGFELKTFWQSSLLEPEDLPFSCADLPQVFTEFRRRIERAQVMPREPLVAPHTLPPRPIGITTRLEARGWRQADPASVTHLLEIDGSAYRPDSRSSFPFFEPAFAGGETAALAHIARYFGGVLPQTYKQTRNGLIGADYSTKLSPWLATGALSPRTAWQALREHEARVGANDSTYWIGFELWWRDYFRFLHRQHGRRLYYSSGLAKSPRPKGSVAAFERWSTGQTGQEFIDAGMRELAATGYLSNRLRQNVASFWIHDLQGDWRLGAAWFEHCLIDYDVYSNQGNWLYLAGCGTDPRAGRWFNPAKQANDYDSNQTYRRLWKD